MHLLLGTEPIPNAGRGASRETVRQKETRGEWHWSPLCTLWSREDTARMSQNRATKSLIKWGDKRGHRKAHGQTDIQQESKKTWKGWAPAVGAKWQDPSLPIRLTQGSGGSNEVRLTQDKFLPQVSNNRLSSAWKEIRVLVCCKANLGPQNSKLYSPLFPQTRPHGVNLNQSTIRVRKIWGSTCL